LESEEILARRWDEKLADPLHVEGLLPLTGVEAGFDRAGMEPQEAQKRWGAEEGIPDVGQPGQLEQGTIDQRVAEEERGNASTSPVVRESVQQGEDPLLGESWRSRRESHEPSGGFHPIPPAGVPR
jgi:hypothetical protein